MKNHITWALGACTTLLVFTTSCEKDEVQVKAEFGATPTLTASTSAPIELQQANEDAPALTFSWKPYTLALSEDAKIVSPVTYTLQIAKSGTNFATIKEFSAGSSAASSVTLKTKELNNSLVDLGLPTDVPAKVDVRLKTSVVGNVAPIYSPVTTVTVTPYKYVAPAICEQPAASKSWSIIGPAGNGWNDGDDLPMTYDCATDSYTYTGPLKADSFKFRYGRAWSANLGGTSPMGGALTHDGPDMKIPAAGTYTVVLKPGPLTAEGKASPSTFTISQ